MYNQLKTAFLLAALSGLLLVMGHYLGGNTGIAMAFGFALLMNFFVYFYSDKLVLKMYRAKKLDPKKYAHIYDIIEELCHTMNMPRPKLWLLPTDMANAFATGRNPKHASVAVTEGILKLLDEEELRGVLAHELSHVKNRDILVATVAATIAMAIGYLAHMLRWSVILGGRGRDRQGGFGALLVAIVMPFAALLIQLAISRSREYLADETGAECCHDPLALASALEKLHLGVKKAHYQPTSPVETATSSLFIVFPFTGGGMMSLFSTHPPMKKRVDRLRRMAEPR